MSKKTPSANATDLIIKSVQEFDGMTLASSQNLLGGLDDLMKDADFPPEMAEQQADLIKNLTDMQALMDQVQAAQDAGDTDAMMALSNAALEMSGIDMTPEVLPAPFDALQEAIDIGDIDALRANLQSKPDLNQLVGQYQSTPLLWAMRAEDRSPAMLAVLVEAGADVTFATPEGYTALHNVGDYSCRYGVSVEDDYAVAAYLVDQGADLSARNHYGWTPLDRAIVEGVPEEVHALLRVGADPNLGRTTTNSLTFETGDTPLANAVSDPEKVKLLLAFGADPATKSAQGATVLDEITRLLADEDETYPEFYDALRASRELITAAIKPN